MINTDPLNKVLALTLKVISVVDHKYYGKVTIDAMGATVSAICTHVCSVVTLNKFTI